MDTCATSIMLISLQMLTTLSTLRSKAVDNLNFFRVHLLFFTFAPLIFSAIFYAVNGATHVRFIDALFVCFSATTICGLVTVDLSSVTGFQQGILFLLTSIGHPVVMSWVMVYIRRRYFNKHLQHIVELENARQKNLAEERALEGDKEGLLRRLSHGFVFHASKQHHDSNAETNGNPEDETVTRQPSELKIDTTRSDAIRHTSAPLQFNEPNGLVADADMELEYADTGMQTSTPRNSKENGTMSERIHAMNPNQTLGNAERKIARERPTGDDCYFSSLVVSPGIIDRQTSSTDVDHNDHTHILPDGISLRRNATQFTQCRRPERARASLDRQSASSRDVSKNRGLGGFPYPTTLLYRMFRKAFTSVIRRIESIETNFPSTPHCHRSEKEPEAYPRKYFSDSFNAPAGRNSNFYELKSEDLEELGGVEYRALNALLWIIAIYHIVTQLLAFTIVAPYMCLLRWRDIFSPPNLHRHVPPVWYSAFQVMSAFTTSGMSLVDQSMVPFQTAYPLIFVCAYLILAGNLAFPCFLRFFVWSIMKLLPGTRLNETLRFLLEHPRRCYFYLFPSLQTWLLLTVVLLQSGINYLFFLILDIGESTFEAIPLGVRFAIGVLQATAVRAAGFATTALGSLAPSLLVWFVIMMYIGVYPIALSVHATNVYEEKSLGVVEEDEDEEPKAEGSELSKYYRYLTWHARRQLAFDMWWLGMVLFLLCIIERDKIQDEVNFQWFTIFALIFEIMSAYAGVGISLGVPYANYSFSGALSTPSKLILIAVMIRGRHRGLPVAIDRAVMLPHEFRKLDPNDTEKRDGEVKDKGKNPEAISIRDDSPSARRRTNDPKH